MAEKKENNLIDVMRFFYVEFGVPAIDFYNWWKDLEQKDKWWFIELDLEANSVKKEMPEVRGNSRLQDNVCEDADESRSECRGAVVKWEINPNTSVILCHGHRAERARNGLFPLPLHTH